MSAEEKSVGVMRILVLIKFVERGPRFFGKNWRPHTLCQWTLPLPPYGVLLTSQIQSGQHPRQGCNFTYQLKY
jgi:hypothetical protein